MMSALEAIQQQKREKARLEAEVSRKEEAFLQAEVMGRVGDGEGEGGRGSGEELGRVTTVVILSIISCCLRRFFCVMYVSYII